MASFTLDNPLVQTYIAHTAILVLKMLVLSPMTGMVRVTQGAFANPEDARMAGRKGKVKFDDPEVERLRRAHRNDLENIPAFWVLAPLYILTNPVEAWAILLFRAFTVGRVLHTFVYAVWPFPQPARAIAFFVPFSVLVYMGVQVLLHYSTAL